MAQSTETLRRWRPPAIVILAATASLMTLCTVPPAMAKQMRLAHAVQANAPRRAGEPIMAIVSLKSQKVTVYDADGWIMRAPVSSGMRGRETPAGVFAVVEKDKDHHSNLYDDASMPDMLRITWSGIALHGGPLPGYAASHGCVRMPYGFAETLFGAAPMDMRVIIAPKDVEPVAFSDPALPQPNAAALAAAPVLADKLADEAADAAEAADEAKSAAAQAAHEAAPLTASLRKLEKLQRRVDAELAFANKVLAAADTDQAKARGEELEQKATAKAVDLETQLGAVSADAKVKLDAAKAAEDAAKAAEAKKTAAAKAAHDAKAALEPVSIFISRATQRLYVRRGFGAAFDVPITIRNPDQPIGTHIYTAVAGTDAGLRWTAVSIDGADDAKDALDRVTIPQDVLDQIAPTAVPRSSIIISDDSMNRETNYRTEFIVVLNDQPQGGLAMRRQPEDVRVARGNGWDDDAGPFGFARRPAGRSYYPAQRPWW
jgi:L,D-transpeptidase catalytic domain